MRTKIIHTSVFRKVLIQNEKQNMLKTKRKRRFSPCWDASFPNSDGKFEERATIYRSRLSKTEKSIREGVRVKQKDEFMNVTVERLRNITVIEEHAPNTHNARVSGGQR